MELWAAVRAVATPVNIVMGLLLATGVALLSLGALQIIWPEEPPPAEHGSEPEP